jgi:hypothetical protein
MSFEGPNEDGNYSVLVGIIWSMRLAKIAESLFNPSVEPEPQPPDQPIRAQLQALGQDDPVFYCYVNGLRVWTNEKGERVIVSFGSVPATSSIMIDKDRATLAARSAIQRFIAELVETKGTIEGEFTYQETEEGGQTFDNEAYQRRIDAKAKQISLRGATPIMAWRGNHPYGEKQLQVVAVTWSPETYAAARSMEKAMGSQETRMKRQGVVVPDSTQRPSAGTKGAQSAPVKQGPPSNPRSF